MQQPYAVLPAWVPAQAAGAARFCQSQKRRLILKQKMQKNGGEKMNKVIKNAKNGRIVAVLTTEDGYIRRYISHALYINRTFCMEDGDASGLPKMAEFAAFWAGHPKLIGYFIGGLSDAGLLVKVINDAYAAEYHMACMPFGYCEKDQKGAVRPLKPSLVYVAPYYMDGRVIVKKEPGYAVGYGRVEFFSGQLMQGESAAEAAMRILKEETGLDTANPLAMPCGFIDTDLPGSDAAVVSLEVSEKIDCARIRENSTICMTEPEELLKRVADGAECGSASCWDTTSERKRRRKRKKHETSSMRSLGTSGIIRKGKSGASATKSSVRPKAQQMPLRTCWRLCTA